MGSRGLGVTSNGLASHSEGVETLQKYSSVEGIRANERLQKDFTLLLFIQGKFSIVFNNLCLLIFSFIFQQFQLRSCYK